MAARGAALLLLFSALPAGADSSRVWSWHQFGMEIHSPSFSPDGRQVAFSLQRVELTGRDVRGLSPSQLTERIEDQREDVEDNARVFDPAITLLTLATRQVERIGYGYEPAFSPDGSSVAFQHQKNPLRGRRPLAAALTGNEIWLHERGKSRVLAAPASGWFGQPKFAPGGEFVIFTLQESVEKPTSGIWRPSLSGPVGVGRVDLATGAVSTLYAPRAADELPHFINQVGFVGGRSYALVTIVQAPPDLKSNQYLSRLVALDGSGAIQFDWRSRDVSASKAAFGTWPDGRIAVFDSVWKPVGAGEARTAAPSTTRGWRSTPGVLSPDGRKIAREFASGIVVSDTLTGRQIAEFPGPMSNDQGWRRGAEQKPGEALVGITWSPDSKRIAWVEKVGLVTQDFATLRVGSL
jgi:dipeptidyl aminopeptidase/acylaminoacyl peptidase